MRGCELTDQAETGDGDPVLTLQQLVRARMDDRGWSYSDLARRSGDRLTRGRWQQLGTGVRMKSFPEPDNLVAMADALEVDVTSVLISCAQSLGIDARRRGPDLAVLLPAGTDRLSPRMRDGILTIVRAAVADTLDADARADENRAQAADVSLEWSMDDAPSSRRNTGARNVDSQG